MIFNAKRKLINNYYLFYAFYFLLYKMGVLNEKMCKPFEQLPNYI